MFYIMGITYMPMVLWDTILIFLEKQKEVIVMKIEEIIKLWNKSNCNTLMIRNMPCVNHKRDITWGTGFYRKGDTICCGKK